MSTYTPWGASSYSEQHFKGCVTYCTPSHGGIKVAANNYKYLSEYTIKKGINYKSAPGLWYEEDMDYILPLYELYKVPEFAEALKERYKRPTLEQVQQLFPDYEDKQ